MSARFYVRNFFVYNFMYVNFQVCIVDKSKELFSDAMKKVNAYTHTYMHVHTYNSKGGMLWDKNGEETMRFNRMLERVLYRKVAGIVLTCKLQPEKE